MSDTRPATDEKTPEEIWRSMRYAMSDTQAATDEEIAEITAKLADPLGPGRYDREFMRAVLARLAAAEASATKLQAFKSWVHGFLDNHGVPHHPPGPHGAEGCRIGDRMDWLTAKLVAVEAERDANDKTANFYAKQALEVEEQLDAARAENAGLREELNKAAEDEASYSRRCSKVEDENVKLRAVLQQLADSDNANSDLDAKCAARRLLEAKP